MGPKDLESREGRLRGVLQSLRAVLTTLAVLYIVAFVFGLPSAGWAGSSRSTGRPLLALNLLAFAVHTLAIWSRIYISGRPPVTNLYSSAVFIGWGGVILGLVSSTSIRLGIGNCRRRRRRLRHAADRPYLRPTATRSPCCKPCSTRSSGWPRTWSASRWAMPRRSSPACWASFYMLVSARRLDRGQLDAGAGKDTEPHDLRHAVLRHLLQLLRHGAGRTVGRRLVGPVLGLGPQGKRGPDHRALERPGAACPLGRPGQRPRPGRAGHAAAMS